MENNAIETENEENKLIINQNKEKINQQNDITIRCNNYFKNAFFSRLKLNIFIIILSLIGFIFEFFYREPLFNFSLEFEKKWQEKATEETIDTFKFLTKIGGEYLMVVPILIVFCFFTLIKSTVYIIGFLFCLQFHSMMKIWYGNKRPFWEENSLYKGLCEGGFGNPSGHSIITTFLYLSLFIYYKETKRLKKRYIILIIILLFCFFWIIMMILSRIILGMHSVNQVIYGSTLGVIVSLFIFIVFKIHRMPVYEYKKFFIEKKKIYIILGIFCLFIIISFSNVFIFNQNFDTDKYGKILDKICESGVPEYRRFNFDGLSGSSVIFAILGIYLGQIIFWYLIENKYKINEINSLIKEDLNINEYKISDEIKSNTYKINNNENEILEKNENIDIKDDSIDDLINHWNKNRIFLCSSFKNALLIIIYILACFIPLSLFFAISHSSNLVLIFIFKVGIPIFATPFLFYSFGCYYLIKISCGPKEILIKRLE